MNRETDTIFFFIYFAHMHTHMHLSVSVAVLPCNVKRHVFCCNAGATGSEIRNSTHQTETQLNKAKDRAQSHTFGICRGK